MTGTTIGGLARAGGVGVETIRYYQRRGLIETPIASGGGGLSAGVRRYDENQVRRLKFIRAAQVAGFTLDEIGDLLELDATTDRERARSMAKTRLSALDAQIAALKRSRAALKRLAEICGSGSPGQCPIIAAFNDPDRA